MTRADDGKPTRIQQTHVATAINDCRCAIAQPRFQAPGILGIGPADHPNGTRLPALNHLTQQKPAPQQRLQAALVNHRLARTQDLSRVRRDKIGWLTLNLAQITRETFVFTRGEQIG